jgi:hypothetical protein
LPWSPSKESSTCSPDGPRGSSWLRSFDRCEPRAPCLRRGAAPSYGVGSRRRVAQFALSIPPTSVTVFRRDSFDRRSPGAAREPSSEGKGPRWLLTPCALRLREPHLTTRSLTPSVAAAVLPQELHLSRSPPRCPSFVGRLGFPQRPGPDLLPRRLERERLTDPGRLPPARSPTLRSRDAS